MQIYKRKQPDHPERVFVSCRRAEIKWKRTAGSLVLGSLFTGRAQLMALKVWMSECVCAFVCVRTLRWFLTHPIYCSGWLWWITILHVGHVLFSSRYFTRQLLQTGDAQQKCTVTLHRGHTHTHTEHLSFKVFICREKNLPHIFRFPCLIHEKQTVFLGFLTLEFAFVDLSAVVLAV